MNKNTIILGFGLALVGGGIIGYAVGGLQYSAQLEKAKRAFPVVPEMRSVSGTVKSISGSVITIETPVSINPFEDLPTVRKVTVTKSTEIVKNETKDPKVFQAEMERYQEDIQKAAKSPAPTPPLPFNEKELSLSDLKAGDMISVDADKNVKTAASFDAVKITVTGTTPPAAPKP